MAVLAAILPGDQHFTRCVIPQFIIEIRFGKRLRQCKLSAYAFIKPAGNYCGIKFDPAFRRFNRNLFDLRVCIICSVP